MSCSTVDSKSLRGIHLLVVFVPGQKYHLELYRRMIPCCGLVMVLSCKVTFAVDLIHFGKAVVEGLFVTGCQPLDADEWC